MRFAFAVVVVVIATALALPEQTIAAGSGPKCAPPSAATLYPVVEPVFAKKCASCHDSRKSKNVAAQRVFESSSYPFATERPKTLLHDLRGMFAGRGGLTPAERCHGIAWVDGGGLDANGNPPAWRR